MSFFCKNIHDIPEADPKADIAKFDQVKMYKGHKYRIGGVACAPLSKRIVEFFSMIGKAALCLTVVPLFFRRFRASIKQNLSGVTSSLWPVYVETQSKGPPEVPNFHSAAQLDAFLEKETLQRKKRWDSLLTALQTAKPELYSRLCSNPLFGPIVGIKGTFGFWMGGGAIAASLLSKKHQLQGLYVCETMEAFAEQYAAFCSGKETGRRVFIVPTIGSGWSGVDGKTESPNYPQHKISLCVEKTDEGIKVAVLDSSPAVTFDSNHVMGKSLWQGWEGKSKADAFTHDELILRALLKASANQKTDIYIPSFKREFAGGCLIFAFHDAISFLRRKNFFDVIEVSVPQPLTDLISLHQLTLLPPENMVGTQSGTKIQEYMEKGIPLTKEVFPGKKTQKTLQGSFLSSKWGRVGEKKVNHHISLKHLKYVDSVLDTLEKVVKGELSEDAFFALQNESFITSSTAGVPGLPISEPGEQNV